MQTPYFILDSKTLSQNYQSFQALCQKYLPSFKICYSVKTTSLPQVLEILNEQSSNFEIASQNELNLIKYFSSFKIFNSPCKTQEEIKEAKNQACLINADSLSEIDKLSTLGIKECGIRVSFSDSKFGIESTKIKEAIKYAENLNMKVICLHSHPGTQESKKDYESFLETFSTFLSLNKKILKNIKYLDIGGGFPDKIQLKNLSLTLEDYFKLIKKYLPLDKTLILEPGRALVSDSMSLITKVHYIKENSGKKYAILDAGINFLPKVTLSSYKFTQLKKEDKKEEYFLAGPLLFSNDILGKFQGNLKEGDLIKVENVGAYCYNLSWTISYDKPEVELI